MTRRHRPTPRALGALAPTLLPILMSVLLLALPATAPAAAADTETANKALIRDFYATVLNGGDFAAIERFVESTDPKLDREAIERKETLRRRHVPDFEYVVEQVIAEGDTVVVRLRETGTHTGSVEGLPATGERVDLRAVAIYRVEDGKIRERWYLDDQLKLARTVGMRIEKPGS